MDEDEIKWKMEGCDDFVKLLTSIFNQISRAAGKPLTEEEKKNFIGLMMEARKILREKYEKELMFTKQVKKII